MFLFLIKGVLLLASASTLVTWYADDLSLTNLKSFARFTTIYAPVENVTDLPVQGVRDYTSAVCISSTGYNKTREELDAQLGQIPVMIRAQILDQAIPLNCSARVQNSMRASDSDKMQLSSFFGLWNTTCDDENNYQTCVLISGSAVHIAEEMVVGVQKNRTLKHLGTRPCECIFNIFCKTCPIIEEVEIEALVLRSRDPLTLRQHRELHTMLIDRAVRLGAALIETSKASQLRITTV